MWWSASPSFVDGFRLLTIGLAILLLAGCATWRGSARGGSGMKPQLGATVTVPLGK